MRHICCLLLAVISSVLFSPSGRAQTAIATPRGTIVAVPSNQAQTPGGPRTSLYVFVPENTTGVNQVGNGETPASIACIYGVTPFTPGCPKNGTIIPTGGSLAIAVVVYGHYPAMQADLNTFNAHFGLPATTITEICTAGCPNNVGTGWDLETVADVEWVHALAPQAQIYIVEYGINPLTDGAETLAGQAVAAAGGGEVSNGWGYPESSTESSLDGLFTTPSVVYFAAAGNSALVTQYPSVSPNVVSAGGTSISRNGSGNFLGESCWSTSGGGLSAFEPIPAYQNVVNYAVGTARGTPDLSAVADPTTGVEVYGSLTTCAGWCVVGGTDVSSAILAALTNGSGSFRTSTLAELTQIYNVNYATAYSTYYNDITTGTNGWPGGASLKWDGCTGLGTTKDPSGF